MIKVRRGKSEDVPAMVELGEVFWEETPYREMDYSGEAAAQAALFLLENGIVQVAQDDEDLVGFILLAVGPIPFTTAGLAASELAFYVAPEKRGDGVGQRLLKQAENVARQQGVRRINMVHLGGEMGDAPTQAYEAQGYREGEVLYTKEL
ncbi:MAG: GNAT family N-acetyltransferase [Myxococcota bacterium]|nr:GNAT family N-acetyltransferase [Myxococcota bacterium]